jgi:hypothetical protein
MTKCWQPTFTARAPVAQRAAEHRLLIIRRLWGRRDMMQAAINARKAEQREERQWQNGETTTALRYTVPRDATITGFLGDGGPGMSGLDLGGSLSA